MRPRSTGGVQDVQRGQAELDEVVDGVPTVIFLHGHMQNDVAIPVFVEENFLNTTRASIDEAHNALEHAVALVACTRVIPEGLLEQREVLKVVFTRGE